MNRFHWKTIGCLTIPLAVGGSLLGLGIYMAIHASSTTWADEVGYIALIGLGSLMLLLLAIVVVLRFLLRRMFHDLGRDVRGIGRALRSCNKMK